MSKEAASQRERSSDKLPEKSNKRQRQTKVKEKINNLGNYEVGINQ